MTQTDNKPSAIPDTTRWTVKSKQNWTTV